MRMDWLRIQMYSVTASSSLEPSTAMLVISWVQMQLQQATMLEQLLVPFSNTISLIKVIYGLAYFQYYFIHTSFYWNSWLPIFLIDIILPLFFLFFLWKYWLNVNIEFFKKQYLCYYWNSWKIQVTYFSDVKLIRALDCSKDQTLFLSRVEQEPLRRTMFPLGSFYKSNVRQLAQELNLTSVYKKKDSTGICFIGNRKFTEFIHQVIFLSTLSTMKMKKFTFCI